MQTPQQPKGYVMPSQGVHPARLITIADIGTQTPINPAYNPSRKLVLVWEITDETGMFDGVEKPLVVSQELTFSANEKSRLYSLVKGWLGIDPLTIDWTKQLGKSALVTVMHTEGGVRKYANVSNVSAVPKGMEVKEPFNPQYALSLDPQNFNRDVFNKMPNWIQEKIKKSPQYLVIEAT